MEDVNTEDKAVETSRLVQIDSETQASEMKDVSTEDKSVETTNAPWQETEIKRSY